MSRATFTTSKITVTLAFLVIAQLFTFTTQSSNQAPNLEQGETSFILLDDKYLKDPVPQWRGIVLLPFRRYFRSQLDRVFWQYAKMHPHKSDRLELSVFVCLGGPHEMITLEEVIAPIGPDPSRKRRTAFFALFYRTGNSATSGGGDNEWYTYSPDIDKPDETRTVVLRGKAPFAVKQQLRWEKFSLGTFDINVTLYDLKNVEPSGTYYTFSVSQSPGNEHEIMTVQQKNLELPLKNYVQFINEGIGYIFMGSRYAVTTDNGKTWTNWDAEKDLLDWQCCDRWPIQKVDMASDGVGTMTLSASPQSQLILHTKDYGRNWNK